ncbi:reverse transcriptase domain-containing protein, partial [Tanacetum coccineum]
ITRSGMTPEAIEEMITLRVAKALAEQEANRNLGPIIESKSENGDDNKNGNGGGCRNGNGGCGNGNGNQGVNAGGTGIAVHAVRMANSLIDQKVRTNAARQVNNKRKWESQSRDNHAPQQPFRRPDVARAYIARNNKRSGYAGSYPYCNKCRLHHAGPYTVKCTNCNNTSHIARDCKNQDATTNQRAPVYNQRAPVYNQRTPVNNQRALVANQRASVTYFECGRRGHYRDDCPKLKNQSRGNQATNTEARGRVFALGGGENNKDSNVVMVP